MEEDQKYNRQIMWFGVSGQAKIEQMRVAIVGAGGTGSHVAQQLAYLGVRDFLVIDADEVSKTNLNRLIGANDQDVGKFKVNVAKRHIEYISPTAKVLAIQESVISYSALNALKLTDFIFGCVDSDGARLALTEFTKAYEKPYLDIATEIFENDWGGRIFFTDAKPGCLMCANELTNSEIHKDLSTENERAGESKIYGVNKSKLAQKDPSVVSLNGILASLAVTEFIAGVTGIREIKRAMIYRGSRSHITFPSYVFPKDCFYCNGVLGIGDRSNMERYVRS